MSPAAGRKQARPTVTQRRARLALGLGGLVIIVVLVISTVGGGSLPHPPRPTAAGPGPGGDPFGYVASKQAEFTARATAGEAHVLFTKSPGGVMLTAARIAAYRSAINRATAGTKIDPNLLEALVFVESAGEPDAIVGGDPTNAAGLTQILASTGESLLGMHIDLARSRRLTTEIAAVQAGTRRGRLATLIAQRAAADDRFVPARALAATVRYLQIAQRQFGREDLAFESYHMGIGNLHNVLEAYDGGRAVPYVQLFFDSEPDHHPAAYRLLSGFGDDSELYWWRLLGAEQVMHLYRTDRSALAHLATLQTADDAGASVLHPPGHPDRYSDAAALAHAYEHRTLVPLPSNPGALGLAYATAMGAGTGHPALYRGLNRTALRLLIALAARVRTLSGGAEPLTVQSTVIDTRSGTLENPLAATGYSFSIARHYRSGAQAQAFQTVLDQLQALNLIAWAREPLTIEVTVASDANSSVR